MSSTILAPSNTVYVSNIDWKVKKPLLSRALYSLFTRHGKVRHPIAVVVVDAVDYVFVRSHILLFYHPFQVLEVIVLRRDGLRGQAWVIFEDVQAATAAVQAEQSFTFFGKDLKLAYAKETSDRIAKRDGTYVPKAKRKKLQQTKAPTEASPAPSQPAVAATPSAPDAQPSHILFAKDLPTECNEMMLAMLFRQYTGFKEVRIPREGLAFIEFDDEPHATLALGRLNGFNLTTMDTLKLTYGKS